MSIPVILVPLIVVCTVVPVLGPTLGVLEKDAGVGSTGTGGPRLRGSPYMLYPVITPEPLADAEDGPSVVCGS